MEKTITTEPSDLIRGIWIGFTFGMMGGPVVFQVFRMFWKEILSW